MTFCLFLFSSLCPFLMICLAVYSSFITKESGYSSELEWLLQRASVERNGICILTQRKEICCHLHLVRERAPQLAAAAKPFRNTLPVKYSRMISSALGIMSSNTLSGKVILVTKYIWIACSWIKACQKMAIHMQKEVFFLFP